MRIVFVLTYPSYHGIPDIAEWLRWDNRDRRMPGLLSAEGIDVELWAVGRLGFDTVSQLPGFAPYKVRLFAVSNPKAPSRDHFSDAMIDAARADPADLFVLIGTDGGMGLALYDRVLRPDARRFGVVIGGTVWSRVVAAAAIVFTESAVQENLLANPMPRFWRREIPAERMFRLPKSIDTDRFHPTGLPPQRDVVAVSRLIPYKSFREAGVLAVEHSVSVAGGGPLRETLERRHPEVEWLGHVPNADIPYLLAGSRLYLHAGRREYFPRAIVEAMACGLPIVAFRPLIGPDVVPPACGLLVTDGDYRRRVAALLADPDRRMAMGRAARAHAVANHGLRSSEAACGRLVEVARA